MADIYETAEGFKARLLARERAASGELLRAYRLAVARIEARVRDLTARIDEARRQGEIISSGWLYERNRLTLLKLEIETEIQKFSHVASLRVASEQRAAVEAGEVDAAALVGEVTGAPAAVRLGTLNRGAVAAIAGFAADGSPLRALFAARGAQLAQRVADELVAGVAEGQPARVIASRVREAFGGDLARALTIARTETIRAYREAARETYIAHSDVLSGWYWQAALDARTCAMCIAMHGRVFSVTERLQSHPNCRCQPLPIVHGAPLPESGPEWFARQEPGVQRSVLGAGKFEAYRKGELLLTDLVGVRRDPRWGLVRYELPLSAVLSR